VAIVPLLPFATPVSQLIAMVTAGSPAAALSGRALSIALAVVALALLSTAFAYILYFRLIGNVGSTTALTVTYLIPLFAMLWGALVLGEPIAESTLLGCSLILLGTAISNRLFAQIGNRGSNNDTASS
jgi:drug/metabolite transporter (DMT)-like permease